MCANEDEGLGTRHYEKVRVGDAIYNSIVIKARWWCLKLRRGRPSCHSARGRGFSSTASFGEYFTLPLWKFQRSLLDIAAETINEQILNVDPNLSKSLTKIDGFFGKLTRLLNVANSFPNRQHLYKLWKVYK